MRQVVLDTETAGLSVEEGHRIIEIGCIELVNRCFTQKHFHTYLQPDRAIDIGAAQVHGLSDSFLIDKPRFSECVEPFLNFIQGAELIIHNAAFDVRFIDNEFEILGLSDRIIKHCTVLDTLLLAREKHPGQRNNLDALCKRYNIMNSHRKWHGALLDAELLARVYLAMTGGQSEFNFTNNLSHEKNTVKTEQLLNLNTAVVNNKIKDKIKDDLPILMADRKEILAHESFLQKMLNDHGHCIWED